MRARAPEAFAGHTRPGGRRRRTDENKNVGVRENLLGGRAGGGSSSSSSSSYQIIGHVAAQKCIRTWPARVRLPPPSSLCGRCRRGNRYPREYPVPVAVFRRYKYYYKNSYNDIGPGFFFIFFFFF